MATQSQRVAELSARIDSVVRETLRLFVRLLGADEGSLWVRDAESSLVIILNSGPDAKSIELSATTSAKDAQVLRCFETGSRVEDVLPFKPLPRDKRVDRMLDQETVCQISVPFQFQGERVGVLSVVQLDRERPDGMWGFSPETGKRLEIFSRTLSRLLSTSSEAHRAEKAAKA